jgi:AbrB family looped-hinge helix DNA binding protein
LTDVTTLSPKFQISVPKAVRQAHQWKPGQRFAVIPRRGGVMLVPLPAVSDLVGIARGANGEDYRY